MRGVVYLSEEELLNQVIDAADNGRLKILE